MGLLELSAEGEGLNRWATHSVDLVLSIKSWGFHYPIEMHLAQITRILKPAGVIMVTLRRGTGGLRALRRAGFSCIRRMGPRVGKPWNGLPNGTRCVKKKKK